MTKLTISLYDALVQKLGGKTASVPATIHIDEFCEFADIDDFEIDLHEQIARRFQIADIWGIEDVQELRPDLSDEQAWEVLTQAKQDFDANVGINWNVIDRHAVRLFGEEPSEPLEARLGRCRTALNEYDHELTDLLADLRHWCDAEGGDFAELDRTAYQHYLAQRDGKE